MNKFIRVNHDGRNVDVNVNQIERVEYRRDTEQTIFYLRKEVILSVCGDWSTAFYKFLQSGAVWTDGIRYEYAK